MALKLSEIEELINSGKALPALNKFIQLAVILAIDMRTGRTEELPGTQATIIAAVALQKLMNTTDGRKLLGIKAGNKVYNEKEFGLESPQLEIVHRMGCGEITRKQALDELSNHYHKANIYPTRQTLNRILNSLEDKANNLRENLEFILMAADWNGSEDGLAKTPSSVDERGRKQPT